MTDTASNPLVVPPAPYVVNVALGALTDSQDFPVTNDPIASIQSLTPSDLSLASEGTPNADGTIGGTVDTTGAEGSFTIAVAATTASGAAVTGVSDPIQVAAGPATSVEVIVSLGGPVPAPVPDPTAVVATDPSSGLPLYEYTGTNPVDSAWTAVTDVAAADGTTLYTFSGDTAGQPPTGASADWTPYTGTPVAVSPPAG